jgi:hypothetical protein
MLNPYTYIEREATPRRTWLLSPPSHVQRVSTATYDDGDGDVL